MMRDFQKITSLFLEKKSFVLTTHVNPDGDGLGCEYALYHFLKSHGKNVRIVNTSELPENYSFINNENVFERYDAAMHHSSLASVDAIVLIDMNEPQRLKRMHDAVLSSKAIKVVIDHHLNPKPFADVYIIDQDACACGEMLYEIFRTMGRGSVSKSIADGLYIAIMTDTGSFRFPRTTPRVHEMTATLLASGVDPHFIYRKIYDEYAFGRTQLLGKILSTIELLCDGLVTITHVTQQMFLETKTNETDVENIVNFGLSIRRVVATVLCVELKDGVKLSFRSRGDFSVNEVAAQFGGGGHKNAAGARLFNVSLNDAIEQVKESVARVVSVSFLNHM